MYRIASLVILIAACAGQVPPGAGGDDDMMPDANPGGGGNCSLPATTADTGMLTATKAQMCNVSGSMGAQHWYRLAAALPSPMDYVQIELWDNTGPFAGGTVHTGTFTINGTDASYNTCGVCVRGMGDKTETTQKEYFATGGTVNVTAFGTTAGSTFTASISNITFVEIDNTTHNAVTGGCSANVAAANVTGSLMIVGGGGGGGGGGGQCPAGVAD